MNIADMHVYFRQYAQQMGMQNVRAIIPEQIDILINTAIVDIVNKIVRDNVGVRDDKLIKDYSKIGNVDALKTLKNSNLFIVGSVFNIRSTAICHFTSDEEPTDLMYTVNARVCYTKYDPETFYSERSNDMYDTNARIMSYDDAISSINDSILKPTVKSPIVQFDVKPNLLYLPKKNITRYENFVLWNDYHVSVELTYLKYPTKVSITSKPNVDCDLPESLHVDIVKYAAELYKNIVSKGSYYQPQQPTTATNK